MNNFHRGRCKLGKILRTCATPSATCNVFQSSSLRDKLQEKLPRVTWPLRAAKPRTRAQAQSLLVFTVDLHNYTFSLAARDFEERRTTARGLELLGVFVFVFRGLRFRVLGSSFSCFGDRRPKIPKHENEDSVFHFFHGLMNSIHWPALSVWVFIAQLVEHCNANGESTGSNPVEAPKKTPLFRATSQLIA